MTFLLLKRIHSNINQTIVLHGFGRSVGYKDGLPFGNLILLRRTARGRGKIKRQADRQVEQIREAFWTRAEQEWTTVRTGEQLWTNASPWKIKLNISKSWIDMSWLGLRKIFEANDFLKCVQLYNIYIFCMLYVCDIYFSMFS